jgi:acyl dehydratase
MARYFEDFRVDQEFESPNRTITDADQMNYAGLSGNFASIHVDEEMMKESQFGGRLVYGFLIMSVMEGLRMQSDLGRDLEENVVAFYGVDDVRFLTPVNVGDTITNNMTIAEKEERDEETGLLSIKEEGVDQNGETAVVMTTKHIVKRRPPEET